ncbi:MAG TPA: PilN domain-containing protein [Patescibacteria group bacterium]
MFKRKKPDINLLPEGDVATHIAKGPIIFSLVLLLGALGIYAGLTFFHSLQVNQINSLTLEVQNFEEVEKQEVFNTAKLLAQTKKTLVDYKNFSQTYFDVGKKLTEFESVVPAQVQLTSLILQNDGKVTLTGVGPNPEVVEAMVTELRNQKEKFENVSVISVAKNLNGYVFSLSFSLKK